MCILRLLGGLAVIVGLSACGEEPAYLPKPRAYPRINFPAATGTDTFTLESCPLKFVKPTYARIERDTAFFEGAPIHPCWFDVVIPEVNGRIHYSYYPIESAADFDKLRNDAFELAGKHGQVATYIDEQPIRRPEAGVEGFAFAIEGDVASPYQFYVSDGRKHFLRGALYVEARASADSLAPIYTFLQQDMLRTIETLEWID